jgi:formamidopyrimidine-DNA glycosylase
MPELPEVETIKNDLASAVIGDTIESVEYTDDRPPLRDASPSEFRTALVGSSITAVNRRAKNLIICLSGDRYLVVHLRMTGRLFLLDSGEPVSNLTRVILKLMSGRDLRLEDQRKFATLTLMDASTLAEMVAKLGPEPLSAEFTADSLAQLLSGTRRNLKAVLLDQQVLSGLGNIYVDEALFEARLHPERTAVSLGHEETERLYRAIRKVLQRGIETRGTTFSDYRDAFGRPGKHQNHLRVFLRTGQACYECGALIEKTNVAGRGTHTCPNCQTKPER